MIRSMEGFTFDSALNLNMGYFPIKLNADAQKLCTIVFPCHMGKYKYKRLPMGIKIAWFLMSFKTSCLSLSKIWNMLRYPSYLDDLLILTNSSFKDHLLELEMVLAILSTAGMRVNISKSKFFAEQIEYLGYWITRKVFNLCVTRLRQSLLLRRPKQEKKNKLCQFIGIVNYYRDMWFCRSVLLVPLTSLTSSKVKFEWHSSHQQAFDKIKKVI
jgi:hypothetical protein